MLKRLFVTQKRALKLALGLLRLTPSHVLFQLSGVNTVAGINKMHTAMQMYKYKNGTLPDVCNDKYILNNRIHRYPTIMSDKFHFVRPRIEQLKLSLVYRGPYAWNQLPRDISTANNPDVAKMLRKKHFITEHRKLLI